MFTLVRRIVDRLSYIALSDMTTAETQIFKLLECAGLVRKKDTAHGLECGQCCDEAEPTDFPWPNVAHVIAHSPEGVEFDVEVPREWITYLKAAGLVEPVAGAIPDAEWTVVWKENRNG